MPPSNGDPKAEGLDALRLHLLAQPKGYKLRQAELARHFNVDRATIGRWLVTLESKDVSIVWDEQKRVSIDRQQYITHLRLTRHESIVAMLALRLFQQRQDKSDRNSIEMLQKIGIALRQGIAPQAGDHVLEHVHQQRLHLLDQRSAYQRALEAIGDAWIDSRKVQLRYRPLGSRRAFDEVFHPYMLEPSQISHTTYVIGYSETAGAIRARKIERIERTPLVLDEPFTIRPDFDLHRLLDGAWGIWFGEDTQPVTVRLRFTGTQVIRRVSEERWHPSERTERDTEGRLLWTVEIDEPQEMLPWIRGWGADCEVLAPQALRDTMLGEVRRQMRVYGIEGTFRRFDEPDDELFGQLFGA